MGKRADAADTVRSNILDEIIEHIRGNREHLLRIAEGLVHDGEPGMAGKVFVLAERLRVGALDMRIDFLGEAPDPVEAPAPKPKRVRGPRKRKADRQLAIADTIPPPPPSAANGAS